MMLTGRMWLWCMGCALAGLVGSFAGRFDSSAGAAGLSPLTTMQSAVTAQVRPGLALSATHRADLEAVLQLPFDALQVQLLEALLTPDTLAGAGELLGLIEVYAQAEIQRRWLTQLVLHAVARQSVQKALHLAQVRVPAFGRAYALAGLLYLDYDSAQWPLPSGADSSQVALFYDAVATLCLALAEPQLHPNVERLREDMAGFAFLLEFWPLDFALALQWAEVLPAISPPEQLAPAVLKQRIFFQWLRRQPIGAADFARVAPHYLPGLKTAALSLDAVDHEAGLHFAFALPSAEAGFQQQLARRALLHRLERQDFYGALQLVTQYLPAPEQAAAVRRVLESWVVFDPLAAVDQALAVGDAPLRESLLAALLPYLSEQFPERALDISERLANPGARSQAQAVSLYGWSLVEPARVQAWLSARDAGVERDKLIARVHGLLLSSSAKPEYLAQLCVLVSDGQLRQLLEQQAALRAP